MSDARFIEGTDTGRRLTTVLLQPLIIRWRYHMLLMEIEGLPATLLEDLGVLGGDVRGFAWAVANERAPSRAQHGPEPTTTIGSDVWARAFLLQMR